MSAHPESGGHTAEGRAPDYRAMWKQAIENYQEQLARAEAAERDLRDALETLHDFREFWNDNVTQQKTGSNHHNPMWVRVAEVLSKHRLNGGPHGFGIAGYFKSDPQYREASRAAIALATRGAA